MSRLAGFFKKIAKRPLEAIEATVALMLFTTGLWLATPYFYASQVDEVTTVLAVIFGILQVCMAMVLGYALLRFHASWRIKVRRWTTFTYFILLLFYGITGAMNHGLHQVSWVLTLAVALIMGVCHIRLKWEQHDAGN